MQKRYFPIKLWMIKPQQTLAFDKMGLTFHCHKDVENKR